MVLWEITLGTAYFLGLKRSYKLALKIQRRIISLKHPKIQEFVHGRTRAVFDVAVKVHQSIQQRDLEVGRNLGNWILRGLDKMKPSAHIRGGMLPSGSITNTSITKQLTNSSSQQKTPGYFKTFYARNMNRYSDRRRFISARNIWPKPFPTIAMMMMRPPKPAGINIPYRHFFVPGPEVMRLSHGSGDGFGVIRKDIMQWMLRK